MSHTRPTWHFMSTHLGAAYDIGGPDGQNIAIVHGPDENGTDEFYENARLIASAPELLEALKAVSDILEYDIECPPCIGSNAPAEDALGRARAAIAKADEDDVYHPDGVPAAPRFHTTKRPPQKGR